MRSIKYNKLTTQIRLVTYTVAALLLMNSTCFAQNDSSAATQTNESRVKAKPVKNTFESALIIDDQTVMVPIKGTFEADIQHRFGVLQNGYKDLWGIYGSSNIRIGFSYAPIKNLYLGIGMAKTGLLWDGSAKYAILKQTKGVYPVSVTYYGNIAAKTNQDPGNTLYKYATQRWSFFNELIVARKFSDKLSIQAALSLSHQNSVPGYYAQKNDTSTYKFSTEKFDLFSFSIAGRYKITRGTAFIFDYDQPITRFATNNPNPNFAFGFEFGTSGHSFQLFAGNYSLLNPQQNSLYNSNNPFSFTQTGGIKVPGGQFRIGFNITRLWNF
ncbi:MAG: hypothetical protein JST58_11605 [Bacteroidetes bacterium]|nr:hypothetical protein [Bacteroidota bacterium]